MLSKLIVLAIAVNQKTCYGGARWHARSGGTRQSRCETARHAPRSDRRARRRQETIEEILDIATDIMTEEGVNGLSLAEVARRLGVQPPSLYKYFPSLMAVYDALFLRGQLEHLDVMRQAMAEAEPGLSALTAGLEASGRWLLAHRAIAQLLFWRPVPSFEPSAQSLGPQRGDGRPPAAPPWPTPWQPDSSVPRRTPRRPSTSSPY